MQLGLLTAPFEDTPLMEVADWAGANGFSAFEVACWPASGGEKTPLCRDVAYRRGRPDEDAGGGDHRRTGRTRGHDLGSRFTTPTRSTLTRPTARR